MFADAIRAEAYRLSKSRTTWFWSVFFVPIAALVFSTIGYLFGKATESKLSSPDMAEMKAAMNLGAGPLDMGRSLVDSAGALANPAMLLFVLIGAATLYAGDYRWETWRLISARNTRVNLLLAKLVNLVGLAIVSMTALLIAGVIADLVNAAIFGRRLAFTLDAGDVGRFLAVSGLSWLRLTQFAMVGLLAGVMTRSLLAALFVPLAIGAAQGLAMPVLLGIGVMPDSWIGQLIMPGTAYDALKALVEAGADAPVATRGLALKAWTSLSLWTLLPLIGALAWFRRQDLSKE